MIKIELMHCTDVVLISAIVTLSIVGITFAEELESILMLKEQGNKIDLLKGQKSSSVCT